MKNYYLSTFLLITTIVFAIPSQIPFQGRLTDDLGNPINGIMNITFSLYDAETEGIAIWSETQAVNIENGLFSVKLGSLSPLSADDFSDSERWIAIVVDADSEMTPRTKLASVPYAFTDDDWVKNGDDLYFIEGNVGIGTVNPYEKLNVNGNIRIEPDFAYRIGGYPMLKRVGYWTLCVGINAGNESSGEYNTFVGGHAGYHTTNGQFNTFVGTGAGGDNVSGSNNTYIGYLAGSQNEGSRNVFIGRYTGYVAPNVSDKLYIDNNSTNSPLIYGDFSTDELTINGDLESAGSITANTFIGDGSNLTGIDTTDNLGDHSATQNISLSGNWISNDGDSEGLQIEDNGNLLASSSFTAAGNILSTNGSGIFGVDSGGLPSTVGKVVRVFSNSSVNTGHINAYDYENVQTMNLSLQQSGGYVGINVVEPVERLHVNGGIKVGNSNGTNPGTIRWTGSDLQVYDETLGWISLIGSKSNEKYDQLISENEELKNTIIELIKRIELLENK
jgi:hypothetical protein